VSKQAHAIDDDLAADASAIYRAIDQARRTALILCTARLAIPPPCKTKICVA
jgi:hypothetical protein